MGTIKIEFDLPNFEKEINVNVVIRKDGEVVCNTTTNSSTSTTTTNINVDPIISNPEPVVKKKSTKKSTSTSNAAVEPKTPAMTGNFMGMDF